ncbi:MAG: alpha/beta fold hydrolase [Taibaiella sp.]|nr:alpha/beta fold hydrolase [Taibaiella sp.]
MKHIAIAALLTYVLSSCNFNRIFYQAQPIPSGAKKATLRGKGGDGTRTTNVVFGQGFQPTFEDADGKKMNLPFTVESILVEKKAGNKLNCWIVKPRNRTTDACILFLHGNGGNILSHYPAATQLAEQGFDVCIMDYSGYGFSTGKATRAGVLDDASTVLHALLQRDDMKGKKVIVYGQSLGGHLSATVARNNEKMIDGLVVEGAFSSHKDVAAHMAPYIAPIARLIVREQYSAKRSIRDFHKPVLVIHSTEDKMIPYRMGRKIFNAANSPKEFYEIRHGHIEGLAYYSDSIAMKIRSIVQ